MYPYQLSKALSDQRVRDMVAASGRRHRDLNKQFSGFQVNTTWLARTAALFNRRNVNGLRNARSRSAVTTVSGAGPLGCSA